MHAFNYRESDTLKRLHTALRMNETIRALSKDSQLVILNLPAPPKSSDPGKQSYCKFLFPHFLFEQFTICLSCKFHSCGPRYCLSKKGSLSERFVHYYIFTNYLKKIQDFFTVFYYWLIKSLYRAIRTNYFSDCKQHLYQKVKRSVQVRKICHFKVELIS